jgi:DNA-binding NarL/FixJ family response regulator
MENLKHIVVASRYRGVNQSLENTINIIKKGYSITGVTDEAALYEAVKKQQTDILLFDAHFTKIASAYVVGVLHKDYPKMRIVVFELKERSLFYAARFILFGAESYFCKRGGSKLYHRELASILDYQSVLPQNIQDTADQTESAHDGKFTFNKKEREILRLLSDGKSNKDVAAHIRRKEKTVRNIISTMYAKAGVRSSSVELLLFAENRRLIPEG